MERQEEDLAGSLQNVSCTALPETCDLVQDVTTDCSVVAGLSAALRILLGERSVSLAVENMNDM